MTDNLLLRPFSIRDSDTDSLISGFNDNNNKLFVAVGSQTNIRSSLEYLKPSLLLKGSRKHATSNINDMDSETIINVESADTGISTEGILSSILESDERMIIAHSEVDNLISGNDLHQKLQNAYSGDVMKLLKFKRLLSASKSELDTLFEGSSQQSSSIDKLDNVFQILKNVSHASRKPHSVRYFFQTDFQSYSKIRENDSNICSKSLLIQQFFSEILVYFDALQNGDKSDPFVSYANTRMTNALVGFEKLVATLNEEPKATILPSTSKMTTDLMTREHHQKEINIEKERKRIEKEQMQQLEKEEKQKKKAKEKKQRVSVRGGGGAVPAGMLEMAPVKVVVRDTNTSVRRSANLLIEIPGVGRVSTSKDGTNKIELNNRKISSGSSEESSIRTAQRSRCSSSADSFVSARSSNSSHSTSSKQTSLTLPMLLESTISRVFSRNNMDSSFTNSLNISKTASPLASQRRASSVVSTRNISLTRSNSGLSSATTLQDNSSVINLDHSYSFNRVSRFSNGASVFALDIDNIYTLLLKVLGTKTSRSTELQTDSGGLDVIDRVQEFCVNTLLKLVIVPEVAMFLNEYSSLVNTSILEAGKNIRLN